MKKRYAIFFPLIALTLLSCGDGNNKQVISQRYVHKYGYDVSREEWKAEAYPGHVLTTLRDGKTITEAYEDGLLHGSKTETYPHSQTIQTLEHYERGNLAKRITYNIRGVPQKEELFKGENHVIITTWYPNGTPKSTEEFRDEILINGQYLNASNETDSRIENGTGERTIRNQSGDILSKEVFNNYLLTYVETYYPNNTPHTTASYENNLLNGERKEFAMTGEPISVENYYKGLRHGLSTYYQNGYKYSEVPYAHGLKNGIERHYIDGEILVEETEFHDSIKQGASILYCDGSAKTTWYFENQIVSRSKYEQMMERHELIMTMGQK
jgi:antitoxin component YwqK of YwqJK toxin-antitoxin module